MSPHSVGASFLDWSLHYLAGHTHVFNGFDLGLYKNDPQRKELIHNPCTQFNAHNDYTKNHPYNTKRLQTIREVLQFQDCPDFHTVYSTSLAEIDCDVELTDIEISKEFEKMWSNASENKDSLVLLMMPSNKKESLFLDIRSPRAMMRSSIKFDSDGAVISISRFSKFKDQLAHVLKRHFSKDVFLEWQDIQESPAWVRRNFLATHLRPYEHINVKLDLSVSHFHFSVLDLVTSADQKIFDLFDYLQLSVDQSRINDWKAVYQKWKKMNYRQYQWTLYFDQIIEYIVNGNSMDLDRFKIDLFKEAIIQHVLISKYNLTIDTQLNRLPANTKDIYVLLKEHTGNYD
jgi:hypothetical protein